MRDDSDFWDFQHDDDDDEEAAFDEDIENCGQLPAHLGGGCQLAGTEHCDFDCPFRDHPHPMIGDEQDE